MASRDVQLPPTNFSTTVEVAPNPHAPSSSQTDANTSGASMNSSFPSPGSAIKANATGTRGQQYAKKRVFKVGFLKLFLGEFAGLIFS